MFMRKQVHLRGWGLDILPAFGQVLFDVTERTQAQLPPDVCCIFFFGQKHLSQGLNLILHLCKAKHKKIYSAEKQQSEDVKLD